MYALCVLVGHAISPPPPMSALQEMRERRERRERELIAVSRFTKERERERKRISRKGR